MRQAIDSALAQTYPNVEILVINDGSADDGATHDIAASYGEKIRYFQKENGGVLSALNFEIENMRGEYFAWLSHDDFYLPKKIEKQVLALQKHQGLRPAFCVCNCILINEKGDVIFKSNIRENCGFDSPSCFLFLSGEGFNGIMVLIPKKLFDQCGLFTPSLATHEYDMWLRIMDVADVVVEPEHLTYMRIHPDQVSNLKKQQKDKEIDDFLGNGIKNIPPAVYQVYMDNLMNAKGVRYLFDILDSLMQQENSPYTKLQTLIQTRFMLTKPVVNVDRLYSFLLGHSDIDGIKEFFIRRSNDDKISVMIYCENVTDHEYGG